MTLQIDTYIAERYDLAASSKATVAKHLGYWAAWLDDRDLEAVGIADFEAWIEEKGWGNSMHTASLGFIQGYLKWAGMKEHPLLGHKVKRRKPAPGRALTKEEVFKLLAQCNVIEPGSGNFHGVSAQGIRDYAVLVFLWSTWCRATELCEVQLRRLNLKKQEVVFKVKGGAYETAILGPDARDVLEMWLMVRAEIARSTARGLFVSTVTGKDLTYPSLDRLIRRLGKAAGLKVVSAHDFRRGTVRQHVLEGGSDLEGMARGRWKSHSMYRHYVGSVSLEHLKQKQWIQRVDGGSGEMVNDQFTISSGRSTRM